MVKESKKPFLSHRQVEIIGLILIVLSVLFAMSLASYSARDELLMNHHGLIDNTMGIAGVFISYFLIKLGVGYFAWGFIPLIFAWGACTLFKLDKKILKRTTRFIFGLILLLSVLFSIDAIAEGAMNYSSGFVPGGFIGGTLALFLSDWIGVVPSIIVLITAIVILISGYFRFSLTTPIKSLKAGRRIHKDEENIYQKEKLEKKWYRKKKKEDARSKEILIVPEKTIKKVKNEFKKPTDPLKTAGIAAKENKITSSEKSKSEIKLVTNHKPYILPGVDLLNEAPIKTGHSDEELQEKAALLTKTLAEFGVEGNVTRIIPGPVITMYEVKPGEGVRVNKIANLADDIARVMAAKHIRIVAPIPGKTVVGVEIPNQIPELIHYHSIINSASFASAKGLLTIAIGKTAEGVPFTFDLDKMPHLLVAGTT
ncbi:MAG: DNA translocase FtsK 4TM domain-containing protein, partial [Candidatus Marinimicrobia bacterium]|nr:DNA translocase FtsK 4TM domain-containing protein [Candidatus Neomarinimicrobiota bacterium]